MADVAAAAAGPVIHNVVATANFGCKAVDLARVAWECFGEYNPRTFRAVKLRLVGATKSTALVFASGKVVCTGSNSESAALTAVNVYLRLVRRVHPEARLVSVKVQNIVGTCALPRPVDLEALSRSLLLRSAFDPELFPGLRLKLNYPKAKVLIFCKGKCVIAGCCEREDVARAWSAVLIMTAPYLVAEDAPAPTHAGLTARRIARRKGKI